jgi:hypothetical protein
MIHSSRLDRKTKVVAQVLAMIAGAHRELEPYRPSPVRETDEWLWESATEFCTALDRYAERAIEIKRENRRPPSAPAARPAPCRTNPTPPIYLSSRRDFVEVLTECRDQHLERAEARFVAAGAPGDHTLCGSAARLIQPELSRDRRRPSHVRSPGGQSIDTVNSGRLCLSFGFAGQSF